LKIAINKADEAIAQAKLEQLSIHSTIHVHIG